MNSDVKQGGFGLVSIRSRLIFSYVVLALAVVIVSAMGITNLAVSQHNFENQVNVVEKENALLVTLFDAVNARAVAARNIVLLEAPAEIAIEKKSIDVAFERINGSMQALKTQLAAGGPEAASLLRKVEDIDRIETKYAVVATDIVKNALAGQREQASKQIANSDRMSTPADGAGSRRGAGQE